MSLLDVSIVNVALPTIRTSLGASESDLQWIVSGYALTFGLVLVPAGRFGDARGRRDVFVLGVGLFTLASAAAGLAPSAGLLITARLLQGIGAGIMHPQISGLIQQLFRGAERGRAFGWLGTTIGISTAVGPLLGGILIQLAGSPEGWRWIFFVNLPIGLLAIGLAFRVIPGYLRRAARRESRSPGGPAAGHRRAARTVAADRSPELVGGQDRAADGGRPSRPDRLRRLGAAVRPPPGAGGRPVLVPTAFLHARSGHRAGVLRRLHRHLPGLHGLLAARPGLFGAGRGRGAHPVLARLRGRRPRGRADRHPIRPASRGHRVDAGDARGRRLSARGRGDAGYGGDLAGGRPVADRRVRE